MKLRVGTYSGTVLGDGVPYLMTVTLKRKAGARISGKVVYSGALECSGTWKYTGKERLMTYFVETISVGTDQCMATSIPYVKVLSGDRLRVRFTYDSNIRATLKKVG